MKSYRLKNHNPADNDTTINASIEILDSKLKLNYQVVGDTSKYHFPSKTTQQRANNLWLDTCFELFIANRNEDSYWEINISPSTKWNSYHFTRYKEEMRESNLFLTPQIKIEKQKDKYELSFETTFSRRVLKEKLDINLSVILLDNKGKRSFYTINRRNDSPNFHDRVTFAIFER